MADNNIDPAWVEQMVLEVVEKIGGLSSLPDPDMNLYDDLGLDALDVVECCMEVEEALTEKAGSPLYLTDEVCDKVETVGDLIKAAKGAISL